MFLLIIITLIRGEYLLKKKIIATLILSSLAQADSSTIDENMWSFGIFAPWEFTYVKQDDGKRAYLYPFYGLGAYVDYNNIEWSLYWQQVDFNSKSLHNYGDNYVGYRYGTSLLYAFNPHIKMGTYINKTAFISTTKSSDYEDGTLLSYGLKMVYNPNRPKAPNEKRTIQLNYTFSLGYLDGTDVTAYEGNYQFINGRMREVSGTKTYPDLSGYTFSLGFISKF